MFGRAHEQRNSRGERRATMHVRDSRGVLLGMLKLPQLADNPRGPT